MTRQEQPKPCRALQGLTLEQLYRERRYWETKLRDPRYEPKSQESLIQLDLVQAELALRGPACVDANGATDH
jgi:hypothetical protein